MSTNDHIDLRQNRREWLKTSAAAVGASLLPLPAVAAEISQAEPPAAPHTNAAEPNAQARFFTPAQHALVDGFFTFWALLTLWMLWENLQAPRSWPWLAAYTLSLAFLVLTTAIGFTMLFAGLRKNALEWRRRQRLCPSCGRLSRDCGCR